MKRIVLLTFTILLNFSNKAQVQISGKVLDISGKEFVGANVYLKNTYQGTITDSLGNFSFLVHLTGIQTLVVSFVGYQNIEREVNLISNITVGLLQFQKHFNELEAVTITAGTFESGDAKKSVTLKLLDITTTPSSSGDIYGALSTFPGTQIVPLKGGLYVRGGDGYEAKTFFDGMQAPNPYFANLPDMPALGRFSSILFSGTLFSTGGYSAEYGQALSSAVILNTNGLALKSENSLMLMPIGVLSMNTNRWEKTSITFNATYTNMALYNNIISSDLKWIENPENIDFNLSFRAKNKTNGLLKIYAAINHNRSAIYYNPKYDDSKGFPTKLRNNNIYINSVYSDKFLQKGHIKAGISITKDNLTIQQDTIRLQQPLFSFNQKTTITNELIQFVKLKIGEEFTYLKYQFKYFQLEKSFSYINNVELAEIAFFSEFEIAINKYLATRIGLRNENTFLTGQKTLEPRFSVALKTGGYTQISFAYGNFHQRPDKDILLFNKNLQFESAQHYLFNFQYEKDKRVLRIELFEKRYNQLVCYKNEFDINKNSYNNNGYGYARGIDVFWRDNRTFKKLDYWFSYSFLDTKRLYKNFTKIETPVFVSPHTFSVVAKYQLTPIKTYINISYTYASPKTWFSPEINSDFKKEVKAYNDLSLNLVRTTSLFKKPVILYFNATNILGFNNIYGYNHSINPNNSSEVDIYPIKPGMKRFFIIGLLITLK